MKVKVKSGVYFKKPLMQCLKGERRGNDKEGKEQMGWGGCREYAGRQNVSKGNKEKRRALK